MSGTTSSQSHRRKHKIKIQFTELTGMAHDGGGENSDTNTSVTKQIEEPLPPPKTYIMSELGEHATVRWNGKETVISSDLLKDTRWLGSGAFGNVMQAEIPGVPGLKLAVKRMTLREAADGMGLASETDLRIIREVGTAGFPRVIQFYAALIDMADSQLVICMEACDTSMDRFMHMMHEKNMLTHLDPLLKRLLNDMADALRCLKTKNILHRDIKPSNILLSKNAIFKLCDFGISKLMINSTAQTVNTGTRLNLAPERLNSQQGYGIRTDMWALGITTVEIATNEHPFALTTIYELYTRIETWVPQLPPSLSEPLQELIRKLVKTKKEQRPENYEQILAMPVMQEVPETPTEADVAFVTSIIDLILDAE